MLCRVSVERAPRKPRDARQNLIRLLRHSGSVAGRAVPRPTSAATGASQLQQLPNVASGFAARLAAQYRGMSDQNFAARRRPQSTTMEDATIAGPTVMKPKPT